MQAQETETPAFAKHSLGINAGNGISSTLERMDGVTIPFWVSKMQYAASAALLYQYRPVKWFSLETGLEYNTTKFLIGNPFSETLEIPTRPDYSERMHRWAVPLNLRWYYQHKSWSIYALTGMALTLDWLSKVQFHYNRIEASSNKLSDVGTVAGYFDVAVAAGFGAEYQVTKRVMLRFEERFRLYDLAKQRYYDSFHVYYENSYRYYLIRDWALETNLGVYVTL